MKGGSRSICGRGEVPYHGRVVPSLKGLAVRYARLEEAERIARSGKLSDRESALLSPDIAFIHLHAGGLVAECGYCGCVVDEKWDFCARCGVHFVDCRYVAEFGDLDA